MLNKQMKAAISKMGEDESISFIAWKIAEKDAKDTEKKAALARLNAEFAKQLFLKNIHE